MLSIMDHFNKGVVGKALLVLLAGLIVNFFITLYKRRHALDGLVCKPLDDIESC